MSEFGWLEIDSVAWTMRTRLGRELQKREILQIAERSVGRPGFGDIRNN
jgi:hypothetical protein